MRDFNLPQFVHAYAVAALWSSNEEDGTPLDHGRDVHDIHPDCMKAMHETCADFAKAQHADLREYCERMKSEEWSGEQRAGHDFWLTRNGHGAGFWDRGLGDLGQRLSDAAKVYGSVDLYVGDDGLIHGE